MDINKVVEDRVDAAVSAHLAISVRKELINIFNSVIDLLDKETKKEQPNPLGFTRIIPPESRKKISDAQKKRHARIREEKRAREASASEDENPPDENPIWNPRWPTGGSTV